MNRIGPKTTVEDIKHLKMQHLFDNPKKYSNFDQHTKIYKFSKFKTQNNTPLIPVYICAKSTPWGSVCQGNHLPLCFETRELPTNAVAFVVHSECNENSPEIAQKRM